MTAQPTSTDASALRWVPVRALAARHRPRILAHLLSLPLHDRYLRFGYAASDSQVGHYVDQLDFDRDEIFGIFNRRLDVVAMAHLAYLPAPSGQPEVAEFGVSVSQHARGRGWGARLFDRAVLHARNRRVDTLLIHALAENKAMLHIVRRAGARVDFEGPDAVAKLALPPEDFASHLEMMVELQAAEFDYNLKLQAQNVDVWLNLLGGQPPDSRDGELAHLTQARDPAAHPPV